MVAIRNRGRDVLHDNDQKPRGTQGRGGGQGEDEAPARRSWRWYGSGRRQRRRSSLGGPASGAAASARVRRRVAESARRETMLRGALKVVIEASVIMEASADGGNTHALK